MPHPRQLPLPVPLTAATANPDAATAAAAVFKRHESSSSLSAAAATAALRARPTTPIRVADVQTKRTQRRSASVASAGAPPDQARDPSGLRRRGSSGSMTERTFRTPSPHRPSSSGSGPQSRGDDMPPVPALPTLPKNMDTGTGRPTANPPQGPLHRKVSSLPAGASPVRLASQKLASADTPSWFGAAMVGDLGSVRRTDPAMASPPSSPLQMLAREEDPVEGARPGSQASSINFSYPSRARRGSLTLIPTVDPYDAPQPPVRTRQAQLLAEDDQAARAAQASQVKHQPRGQAPTPAPHARRQHIPGSPDQTLVYDPNSRRMVRQADLLAVQYNQQAVLGASQQPTGAKQKKTRTRQRAGSHLAAGTMGRTKTNTSHAPLLPKIQPSSPPAAQVQPETLVQPVAPREVALAQETRADVEEPAVKAIINSPRIEAKRLEQQRAQRAIDVPPITIPEVPSHTSAASAVAQSAVRRQPSVVREEREPEDAGEEKPAQRVVSEPLDAVPEQRRVQAEASPEMHPPTSPPPKIRPPSSSSSGGTATGPTEQRHKTGLINDSEDGGPRPGVTERGKATHVSSDRTQSNSPARQAHFGPVQDNLTVKHSPPPRSISPRKSAMKHASPPRGTSPAGDTSEASGSVVHEPLTTRKKSVRVSFDDGGNGMASEPASANRNDSPLAVSPPPANRHSWLGGIGRFQDLSPLDDDVVMTPRPALPSFGSMRDRKPRETGPHQSERPLVRPKGETRYSPLLPSPPLGLSNDHAVGAVLSNEHERRAEPVQDPSMHGEPLPPVVTSVEGPGYFSDSSDASSILSSEFEPSEPSLPVAAPEPTPEAIATSRAVLPKPSVNGSLVSGHEALHPQAVWEHDTAPAQEVPAISVSQPTPLVGAESESPTQYFPNVPGGFPEDEPDQFAPSTTEKPIPVTTAGPFEVTPQGDELARPAARIVQPISADNSSDSDGDVFSDAYEDLSDIEGDGFQSLDAVVDSPIQQSPRAATQPEQPSREAPAQKSEAPRLQTEMSSATTAVETPPVESPHDEWEQAKAFWRSLTAEKRAQLEREAIEEAGVEADREEVPPATKQKKKSLERRDSERKALAVQMAQQTKAQQEKLANPDRSYMIQPGEAWTGSDLDIPPIRKTMRDEAQQQAASATVGGPRLRKSMRTSGSGSNTHDHSGAGDRASTRPVSSPPVSFTPPRTTHRRSATQVEPTSTNVSYVPPPLVRRGSTGSESSFKRSRAAKTQGFGLRQSLRPTSPPSTVGDNHSSKRFSLRTLSPTGSASRHAAEPHLVNTSPTQMRATLRDSSTGRKGSGGIRLPSFSLSYGGGKKPKRSENKATGSRRSSRFADSSDEEGGGKFSSGFRSRFEDSSDDEPVTPIPLPKSAYPPTPASSTAPHFHHHLRQESSVASTALPEELEESEASHPPTAAPAATIRRTRSGRGQLLPLPSSAQTAPSQATTAATSTNNNNNTTLIGRSPKRNSFLSVLRHRKKTSATTKISRPEVADSAARRDTRLERSAGQLERIRSRGEGEDEGDEEEEEAGEESPQPLPAQVQVPVPVPTSPRGSRLQKRLSGAGGGKRPMPLPSPAGEMGGGGGGGAVVDGGETVRSSGLGQQQDGFGARTAMLRRSGTTSGNLGTRTLSGGGGGFFHLSPPHRRVASMGSGGVMTDMPNVDASVAGSVAASSTTRKKKFGSLRRMFGLQE